MHEMNDATARQRLLEGAFFVALGVPPGEEFGIDLKVYETGPQFKGVKMIPVGLHLVHFGAGEGEKQGFFFRSTQGTVEATQWDTTAEDLVDANACLPAGAVDALRTSVRRLEMDANLGPYPFDQRASWNNLTNCITDSVLERCGVPVGAKIMAGSSGGDDPNGSRGGSVDAKTSSAMELVPHFPHVGRVARYCDLPAREVRGEASGSHGDTAGTSGGVDANSQNRDPGEITKHHMDGSAELIELISSSFGESWKELLGEWQLSFVLFLTLSSLGGFRHWQALSALLCRCGDALATHPPLFTAFMRMLHAHLKLVPEDFFDVELSKGNFLVPSLSALMQNILPDETLAPSLIDAAKRLMKFLRQRFGLFGGKKRAQATAEGSAASVGSASPAATMDRTEGLLARVLQKGAVGQAKEDEDDVSDDEMSMLPRGEGSRGLRAGGDVDMDDVDGESSELMQLELCEEDEPAIVPFEEVSRVLGSEALGGMLQPPTPKTSVTPGEAGESRRRGYEESTAHSTSSSRGSVSREPSRLAVPSVEHSRRWQDIDKLLSSRAGQPDLTRPCGFPAQARHDGKIPAPSGSVKQSPSAVKVAALSAGGFAASAAKRFPNLFSSVGSREDVMMAAARLVSEGGGELKGGGEEEDMGIASGGRARGSAKAVEEAIAFLEEVDTRKDGGVEAWMLPGVTGGVGVR